jgi:hypothetical protein
VEVGEVAIAASAVEDADVCRWSPKPRPPLANEFWAAEGMKPEELTRRIPPLGGVGGRKEGVRVGGEAVGLFRQVWVRFPDAAETIAAENKGEKIATT